MFGFFSYLPPRDNLIQLPTKADFFLLLVNPILCKKATKNQLGGNTTLRFLSDFLLIYVTLCKVSYVEKKGFLSCFCILFSFAPSLGLAIFKASHVLCVLCSDEVAGYYTLIKDFNYVLKYVNAWRNVV